MSHYTHLSLKERIRLYHLLSMDLSISEISRRLNRHRSTLYRELSRNTKYDHYLPGIANDLYHTRRCTKIQKISANSALYYYVIRRLRQGWSPEQIAGRMKHEGKSYYACAETIYRYIYRRRNKGLYRYLTYKKSTRGKRFGRKIGSGKFHGITLIHERDEQVNRRETVGHWEGDSVCFSSSRYQGVNTWVERKTRFVRLRKHQNRQASTVMNDLQRLIRCAPKKLWQSVTLDQGSEFADFRSIHRKTQCKVYYCDPHSPWQRGSNENFNGRLRRYLPRDIEIQSITQKHLDVLEKKLNNLPRKCLEFMTPNEAMKQLCPSYCRSSM